MHSSYSLDAIASPASIAEKCYNEGLAGFAITDHGSMKGYEKAKAYVKEAKLPIQVIGGCEFLSNAGEVIGLFIESMPPAHTIADFGSLCDAIHDEGGFAILPHPFDSFRKHVCRPDKLPSDLLRLIDGIETFNARSRKVEDNLKAQEWAHGKNLCLTGGSDAHFTFECASAYTCVEGDMPLDIALRRKKTSPAGGRTPFYSQGLPTIAKFLKKHGIIKMPK